jgi:5'-nucleotidase
LRILLTNDDGFHAAGIQTLYTALARSGAHSLTISAPERQQSAKGHSITLFDPLFVEEHTLANQEKGFSVRGTPADSVKIALQGNLAAKPEVLISGINRGYNLGTDVFYSGTVSAAMEGAFLGIRSIAVSVPSISKPRFVEAAHWLDERLALLIRLMEQINIALLNINLPALPAAEWKGMKVTCLGKAEYDDIFESRTDPRGRKYYWQAGTLRDVDNEETDIGAVRQGYISLTPLHYDLTDYPQAEILKKSLAAED